MEFDLLIQNANVVDGSGGPARCADVALRGERIAAVGTLAAERAARVCDARGLHLAPGFIDVHAHDDLHVLRAPELVPKLSQGVTTVVVGNCGISASPVTLRGALPDPMNLLGAAAEFRYPEFAAYAEAVAAAQPALNVAALVGHTALRASALDALGRPAEPAELREMQQALRRALAQGAFGLSSGLAYASARQAPAAEVSALVEVLAETSGVYATHLRSESDAIAAALEEALETAGRHGVPLVISHLKCAGRANWNRSGEILARIEAAARAQRVVWDCYPYAASSSTLDLGQVVDGVEITITWSEPHPEVSGESLGRIAERWQVPRREAAAQLQPAGAIYHCMSEDDVRRVLRSPCSMIGSDGLPNDPHPHPRLWGAFPRVIGHYGRELGLLELPQAVHKMSGLPAAEFGLGERGRIAPGCFADLVLFDAARIADAATYAQPEQPARGVEKVWVNGALSYERGRCTGRRAGRLLRRDDGAAPGRGALATSGRIS